MSALVLHYNFENYVAGSNTIVNKGSLGTAFNATMNGNSSIISHDCATGTSCLSLKGEGTSSGGYLQIPNFTWSTLLSGGPGPTFFTISFWYKKPASSITETNARICDFYYNSTNYFYIYFNSDGNLVMKKKTILTVHSIVRSILLLPFVTVDGIISQLHVLNL